MTFVVGVDTRSRTLHWVASESHQLVNTSKLPGFEVVWPEIYGWLEEQPREEIEEARVRLFWYAQELFSVIPNGTHVFVEEPLALSKNGRTTRLLCLSAGAVWAAFHSLQPDAWFHWVDPATWKKQVLGRGAPPRGQRHKPWIRQRVMEDDSDANRAFQQWSTGLTVEQFDLEPDLYDAWCLMHYGQLALGQVQP